MSKEKRCFECVYWWIDHDDKGCRKGHDETITTWDYMYYESSRGLECKDMLHYKDAKKMFYQDLTPRTKNKLLC